LEAFTLNSKPKHYRNFAAFVLKGFFILFFLLSFVFRVETSFAGVIKIGEINPLSGRFAKNGIEIHQGIEVAVAQTNAKGGIQGATLKLVTRDDQSRPDVAISRAEELCSWEKVAALTGGYVDSLVGPIAAVSQRYKTPYVASASLQKELAAHNNPYFFRVSRLQGFAEPLCKFITERFKGQRLAVLYAATPGSTELAHDLKRCFKDRGLTVRLMEKFRPGTPDFTPLIAKLANMKIEVIVSGGFTPDHILFIRQLKENKISPKAYIGPFGIAYESFISALGNDADYLYSTCAWNPGITTPGTEKASASFVNDFQKTFHHQPNTTNMHGYTSARAIIAAIQKVLDNREALNGENIRQALTKLDVTLPMEHLSFDSNGDPTHYRHVVVQIQKRKLVVVYPPDRASGRDIFPMPSWEQRN
jgi:branched-chain amino acid transport system substrate-binding protein